MQETISEKIASTACCPKKKATNFFDNAETAVQFRQVFATKEQAEQAEQSYRQKIQQIESEPCQIHSEINSVENGFELNMQCQFSCQAEAVIFQMALR